ncbi:choline kinase [Salix suchowensis]|nr:choline kinase [Salix suchowensis]
MEIQKNISRVDSNYQYFSQVKLFHNTKLSATKMVMKTSGFIEGSFPDELERVLRSVGSELGDVVDDMEALQVVFRIIWPTKCGNLNRNILVRIYGEGVDAFFNRDNEIKTFECMSKHGQGPRLLGRFADGRIEEFIHARTLSAADLRDHEISALVAAKMREFHDLEMPGPRTILLWNRMRCERICLDSLENEINMLEKELSHDHLDIGFCHNDLQYGNIIFNPVAYDIANHFCEMVANYHSETPHILDYIKYPELEERHRFVNAYLSSAGKQPGEDEVELLLQEVEKYTLASHLFWGLWGIISGHVNKIDFDYMEYARQRFQQYWMKRKALGIL